MPAAFAPLSMNAHETTPLALYIHWPFCVSKCPYCDFNSHVRAAVDIDAWTQALLADLAHEAALTRGRTLGSIAFGGGTPSLMPPALVAALIDAARAHWSVADTVEIALEANPSSVEAVRFAALATAGINRISLGLQALDDAALAFLGREHSVDESLRALDIAQAHFARVSCDLIYARPDLSLDAWQAELARAIGFGTEHLSLYQLTIEPGTRFATLVDQGQLFPLGDDAAADQFAATRAMTAAAGLPAYEISNHAEPGGESRHNLTYWRMNDYVGIGPGAHGRRGGMATVRHRKPENFLSAVARNGHGCQVEDRLSARDVAVEALLMGLRLNEGVDIALIAAKTGIDAPVDMARAARLAALGLVTLDGDRLRATEAGFGVLDSVLAEIVC